MPPGWTPRPGLTSSGPGLEPASGCPGRAGEDGQAGLEARLARSAAVDPSLTWTTRTLRMRGPRQRGVFFSQEAHPSLMEGSYVRSPPGYGGPPPVSGRIRKGMEGLKGALLATRN